MNYMFKHNEVFFVVDFLKNINNTSQQVSFFEENNDVPELKVNKIINYKKKN